MTELLRKITYPRGLNVNGLPVDPADEILLNVDSADGDGPPAALDDASPSDVLNLIASQRTRLNDITRALEAGDPVPAVTVRTFLSWFWRSQRRGRWIVSHIREQLQKAGLKTVPDFESTYLDADISFELSLLGESPSPAVHAATTEAVLVTEGIEVLVSDESFADPTYRISKLASANRGPISAKPDSKLAEAVTLMMANDFFQLPVMVNDRDVKGIISWETIGTRLALGQSPEWVREAMDAHAEVSSEASLFTAIPVIVEHGYALVRSPVDKRIVGIITTSDLSLQFQQLSEPFLLLGEIENHLRKIIGSRFGAEELAALKDPSDVARSVKSVADLSIGEYQRLLEDPSKWQTLKLDLDRAIFVQLLEKVRKTRNEVMHFDPDGIEDKSLHELRDFVRLLRRLQSVGAT